MNDRIKLAEAMGWQLVNYPNDGPMWRLDGRHWSRHKQPPDPFTDANDDYAVLEWMRQKARDYEQTDGSGPDIAWEFMRQLELPQYGYRIGDHARAALKVLP